MDSHLQYILSSELKLDSSYDLLKCRLDKSLLRKPVGVLRSDMCNVLLVSLPLLTTNS
jgi:hypothetical protein